MSYDYKDGLSGDSLATAAAAARRCCVRCVTLLTRVPFRLPIPETDGYDDVLYRPAVWYIGPVNQGQTDHTWTYVSL